MEPKSRIRIVTADERMAQDKGVKALVVGPPGAGKTSLMRTLPANTTLFVDLEAGDLAIQDVKADTLRPKTWDECRDLAVYLGGPNPSLPHGSLYGSEHYKAICDDMGGASGLSRYNTYFIDSITVAARLCLRWCENHPDSTNKSGKRDMLTAYGMLGREMIGWLTHLQHTRDKNVIFVGILESVKDDFNVSSWQLQIDGSKAGRELPGIVDQIITLQFVDFGDGKPVRALVCTSPNQWGYPAKDRSGRLEQIEEPHLGKLLAKLTGKGPRQPLDHTITRPATEDNG
jgi:AAA domain